MVILDHVQQFLDSLTSDPELVGHQTAAFDPITHCGCWRHVLIRESRTGDCLLLFDIHPQQFTQEELNTLDNRLLTWFVTARPTKMPTLTSLYLVTRLKSHDKLDTSNTRLLFGKDHIVEKCCGLFFKVSLNAFFQVNTLATKLLYEEIARFATGVYDTQSDCSVVPEGQLDSILLDICCGTGTIGLCLAKYFSHVFGVELIPCAVADAEVNAQTNGLTNASFHCGRAELVLPNLIGTLAKDRQIIVVVDPPRSGLHTSVIQSLRRCDRVKRIVYVSCSLEGAMQNFIDFVRPCSKRFPGQPFVPILARPVDLFPYTYHMEVILLLQRIQKSQ